MYKTYDNLLSDIDVKLIRDNISDGEYAPCHDNANRHIIPISLQQPTYKNIFEKFADNYKSIFETDFNVNLSKALLSVTYNIDKPGYYIDPHTDNNTSIILSQIYCPRDDTRSDLYGTRFYTHTGEVIDKASYIPGSGYVIKPTRLSYHGIPDIITEDRHSILLDFVTVEQLECEGYNINDTILLWKF